MNKLHSRVLQLSLQSLLSDVLHNQKYREEHSGNCHSCEIRVNNLKLHEEGTMHKKRVNESWLDENEKNNWVQVLKNSDGRKRYIDYIMDLFR